MIFVYIIGNKKISFKWGFNIQKTAKRKLQLNMKRSRWTRKAVILHGCQSQQQMNNSPSHSFQLFSPFLKQHPSPILSPFPHLRKISDDYIDLVSFKLEGEAEGVPPELEPPSCQYNLLEAPDYTLGLGESEPRHESGCEEAHSPAHSQRCEMPSTRFHEPRVEQQPPFLLLSDDVQPSIEGMIEFLVENSQLREDMLLFEGRRFNELGPRVEEVFKILMSKFRKLKKTKEELTKYCMRKAFKYVSERGKRDGTGRGLEGSMKRYFAQEDNADSFSVPFKKNSAEKTMNGNFLRSVFGCPRFAADYRGFLNEFQFVMREDNNHKVTYLAKLIEEAMQENNMGKIESMRRLPWTIEILDQTRELAASLPQEANGRRQRRTE